MIKRDALKYQWYGSDVPEVLFDLERDPGETKNFIDDPQYAEVLLGLREERQQRGFGLDSGQTSCADMESSNAG